MVFGLLAQLLIAWFTTGVLVCGIYFIKTEGKKDKSEPADLEEKFDESGRVLIGKVYGKDVWLTKQTHKNIEEIIPDGKERDKFIREFLHKIASSMREGNHYEETS